MKRTSTLLVAALLSLGILSVPAQMGGPSRSAGGPSFGGATSKLYGDNQSFTSVVEFQITDPATSQVTTMPGKLAYDAGKSRFEMNMSEVKGGNLPPSAAEQMKQMGLDSLVSIARPDLKTSYLIYPGMQSYVENPVPGKAEDINLEDFKIETAEIGKETVEGHACVKNKVTVTDKDGTKHESTVWNATDLNKFPVKIESNEQGHNTVMLYKNVSLKKPDAGAFEVPAAFTKYTGVQEMMQAMIAKKMGSMMGHPPGQ